MVTHLFLCTKYTQCFRFSIITIINKSIEFAIAMSTNITTTDCPEIVSGTCTICSWRLVSNCLT